MLGESAFKVIVGHLRLAVNTSIDRESIDHLMVPNQPKCLKKATIFAAKVYMMGANLSGMFGPPKIR